MICMIPQLVIIYILCSRGIYFAAKSSYSDKRAFCPAKKLHKDSWTERPDVYTGDREMLLTKLLVGNEIDLEHTKETETFLLPPMIPGSKLRYDTVTGMTNDCRVWTVYENSRAYPEYLVRYYYKERGEPVPMETEPTQEQSTSNFGRSSFNGIRDLEANHNNSLRNYSPNQSDQELLLSYRTQIDDRGSSKSITDWISKSFTLS